MRSVFLNDEAGVVTIDFVALIAGVLMLGLMVVSSVFSQGVEPLVAKIDASLSDVQLASVGSASDVGGAESLGEGAVPEPTDTANGDQSSGSDIPSSQDTASNDDTGSGSGAGNGSNGAKSNGHSNNGHHYGQIKHGRL